MIRVCLMYDGTPRFLHSADEFTGKERDSESGLDYFGARYFGSSMGRFMSPDPLGGSLANPQSLNRYAYALNNPLRFTDPTGMYVTNCASGDKKWAKNASSFEKSRQHDLKSKNAGIRNAAGAYGNPGQKNRVTVAFGDPGKGRNGLTAYKKMRMVPTVPKQQLRFGPVNPARSWTALLGTRDSM